MKHKTPPPPSALIDEPEQIICFVLSRRQPDGGYSFARSAPSTLEDTYFALMVMRLLSGPEPSRATSRYLSRIEPVANLGPRLLRFLTLARRACGLDDLSRDVIRPLLALKLRFSVDQMFEQALLSRLYQTRPPHPRDVVAWLRRRSRAKFRETELVARHAVLLRLFGIRVGLDPWRRWLRAAQGQDGGFGFVPGSTSYLEGTWAALQGMEALAVNPTDPTACEHFILRCRSADGVFGRQSQTVPSLGATFQALESLRILGEWRALDGTRSGHRESQAPAASP